MPAGRPNPGCAPPCSAAIGFIGPRTVFEGTHGLFHGFAHSKDGNYGALTDDFGKRWVIETLAFKPYPCGTMAHPFIDCARRLARERHRGRRDRGDHLRGRRGNRASAVGAAGRTNNARRTAMPRNSRCPIASPRASAWRCRARPFHAKQRSRIRPCGRWRQSALTRSIPKNPYPRQFTGHIRATLKTVASIEERQPHLRGGAHEPLTRQDIEDKFMLNARHGGWDAGRAKRRSAPRPAFRRPDQARSIARSDLHDE